MLKYSLLAGLTMLAITPAIAQTKKKQVTNSAATSRKLLDPANIDPSVSPGQNFYLYANGSWLKKNPIPADQTRWGSFSELQENNYKALRELLDSASMANAEPGADAQKVGDFYKSGMDTAAIERAGLRPLEALLNRINNIPDVAGLMHEVAFEHTLGISPLFAFAIGPDDKNVSREITNFYQGGLGMPDRDYYFKTDARSAKVRAAYKAYLVKLFTLMGEDAGTSAKDAADEYKLEEKLAGASMTRVEMRDPYNVYNKYNLATISSLTPGISWRTVFRDLRVINEDSLLVAQPKFFQQIDSQLAATPLSVWKKYMAVQLVMDMSPFLSSKFDEAHFDFFGRTLRGQQAQRPRWKRVEGIIDGSIGDLLGKMYVDKNFKPEAKQRMMELVNNLQQTYADRIKRLDWMSDSTKQKALAKLNIFLKKIGYTDHWKDYTALTISPDDYVKNVMSAAAWQYNYELVKLGRAVDRTEWGMTPPTVNAYYNPAFNEIVFPAGILQYPFFDGAADDAVNYGGIGAVIGHEMTHGFDDQGRQYDASGNLHDWWGPSDAKNFLAKAQRVIDQFNNYTVLDTVHVNGELTEGENLADLGGIAIAYEAFMKTQQAKDAVKIDGFTPEQRFFLSWAQVWRANTRPEEMASRIVTDPHSPSELRCNAPLSNMPEFYKAFDIKPGDKMYRPEDIRASVW